MTARLDRQVTAEIASAIRSTERRRMEAGKGPLTDAAKTYQDQGLTPYRYRVDLRRAILSVDWLTGLQDSHPHLTDAQLDTAMRHAIADAFPLGDPVRDWATSQPLKR